MNTQPGKGKREAKLMQRKRNKKKERNHSKRSAKTFCFPPSSIPYLELQLAKAEASKDASAPAACNSTITSLITHLHLASSLLLPCILFDEQFLLLDTDHAASSSSSASSSFCPASCCRISFPRASVWRQRRRNQVLSVSATSASPPSNGERETIFPHQMQRILILQQIMMVCEIRVSVRES